MSGSQAGVGLVLWGLGFVCEAGVRMGWVLSWSTLHHCPSLPPIIACCPWPIGIIMNGMKRTR